jgi:DNA-binding NarL/FixJ family response regulator
MAIKVMIVDNHQIIREGLRKLLEMETDMELVSDASTGDEALRLVAMLNPDVIVMDINMPDMNGIEATRRILDEDPAKRVLFLSMESDRRFIVEALESGASGYVLKDSCFEELASAIRTVAEGETYLDTEITKTILKDYTQRITNGKTLTFGSLTARERQTICLIADGRNTKEIAAEFGVSVQTIEVHRHNIMKKLNLYSVAELTKYAVREGLTSLK